MDSSPGSVQFPSDPWHLIGGPPLLLFGLYWGLFGILSVQVYIYHVCFPRNPPFEQSLVYTVYTLDCIQTFMMTTDVWNNFIRHWGRPDSWTTIGLQWFTIPILSGIISVVVQVLFAQRLWVQTKSCVLCGAIVIIALLQGSAAITSGIQLKLMKGSTGFDEVATTMIVWLSGSCTVNVIIAASMNFLLFQSRKTSQPNEIWINRFLQLVLEAGTIQACVSIAHLALFLTRGNNTLHLIPGGIIAKVYSNTMLSMMNNRILIHRGHIFLMTQQDDIVNVQAPLQIERGAHNNDAARSPVHVDVFQQTMSAAGDSIPQREEKDTKTHL